MHEGDDEAAGDTCSQLDWKRHALTSWRRRMASCVTVTRRLVRASRALSV